MKKAFTVLFIAFIMIHFGIYLYNVSAIVGDYNLGGEKPTEMVRTVIQKTDSRILMEIPLKEEFVGLNGLFLKWIGKDIIEDQDHTYDIYKMDNGQLTFTYSPMDVRGAVKSVSELKQFCDDRQVQLLYFMEPYKVNKYDNQLPDDYLDGSNLNADRFLDGLKKEEVDYVDYREVLQSGYGQDNPRLYSHQNMDYSELFFDGDHHWKEEAAFNAYVYLMDYLKQKYGVAPSKTYTDIRNFDVKTYEKSFLGSQYSRIKGLYADVVDDFTVIKPQKTKKVFTHEIYNKNGKLRKNKTRKGTFENSVMYLNTLNDIQKAKRGRDNVYMGHNPAVDVITNESVESDSILILEDSFGRPISAFTALNFHKVYVMDLRYYKKSVREYLETHPDIKYVLICYPPTCFKESTYREQFDFGSVTVQP